PRVVVLGRRGRRPPCATHRALGEAWLADAVDEQAAVVAFWRLARDLQALGAPAGLLAACLRAAAEEARHARGCFAVAGHLLGLRLAPVAERLPVDAPLDAPMLAAMNLRDGRFNEGVAARQAGRAASAAMVPAVRALLSAIAGEEAAHARLADGIEAWLVQAFGAPVRAAAAEARAALPDQAPTLRTVAAPTALARAFGRLDAAGKRAAFADAQRSMGGSRCAG
ncbi:MAG: ferritin-like domain-containing protein, partial [Myxococcales bacterium]|nr:ferritin-like domain-containing protein [Myxococcales bacterium]